MQWAEGVATPAHGAAQTSLGHGTASFKLVPWSSLPADWRRPVEVGQLREAAVAYECDAEQLVAETLVELPDKPWGMAYFQWAIAELEALPADQRCTFLRPMLVPSAEYSDGRAGAQRCLLDSLVHDGFPAPCFVRIFKLRDSTDDAGRGTGP